MTNLHAHNDSVQIQHGLPVLAQDVQADVALQINIRMVDFLRALDLGRVVGEVLVHGEAEVEDATFVHALVRFNGQGEVEDVIGVGEGHFHRVSKGKFLQVCRRGDTLEDVEKGESSEKRTSLHAQLRRRDLLLFLACSTFGIFSLLLLLFL